MSPGFRRSVMPVDCEFAMADDSPGASFLYWTIIFVLTRDYCRCLIGVMTAAVQVIQSIDAAAALFSAPRLRILAELAEPDTAAAIARRVGLPRQQVSYHVRELEHAGLVTFVEERRKGNCVERVIQAAA